MADASVQSPVPESPATKEPETTLPDYVTSPNAVFNDEGVQWRYGSAPDYSKTRKVWEAGKKMNHAASCLEQLVENLVKNWEVEASFKPRLQDWRTIDHDNYTFAINGGPPQSAEHMLKVGTYNAIIAPNEYYSPENSDFASSHKTFKRMMPTFAWEVVEVYSQPPKVAFKWRHWGVMKNDYIGFNDKGEKITAKAHGGPIEIFGVTVAQVDDKIRLQAVDTWFDPLDMFRQIAPHGIVNKEIMNRKVDKSDALDAGPNRDGVKIAQEHNQADEKQNGERGPADVASEDVSNSAEQPVHDFNASGACPFAAQNSVGSDNAIPPGHPDVPSAETMTVHAVDSQANGTMPIDSLITETAPPTGTLASTDSEKFRKQVIGEVDAGYKADVDVDQPEFNLRDTINTGIAKGPDNVSDDTEESAEATGKVARNADTLAQNSAEQVPRSIYSSAVSGDIEDVIKVAKSSSFVDESVTTGTYDAVDQHLERPADQVHPHPKNIEESVKPSAGEAVAAPVDSEETRETQQEMSNITPNECPTIMNRE